MIAPTRAASAVALLVVFTSCRSYEAAPLDPPATLATFLERRADDPGVVAFARRLAETEADERSTAYDPSDGIDVGEAEVLALFFNPELRRRRAEAGVAAAVAGAAGAYADPVFGLDAERIVESVDDPWVIGGTIGITIPLGGRIEASKTAALAALDAERAEVLRAEWEIRRKTARAYYERGAAFMLRDALARHVDALSIAEATIARLADAGEATRPEARIFTIERLTRAAELESAEFDAQTADLRLRALIGLSPSADVRFADGMPAPRNVDDPLFEQVLAQNPSLAARRAAYAAAEAALAAAIAAETPDLVLSPGLASDEGLWRALFGFSIAPPLFDGNRLEIAAAEARRAAARAAFETELETLYGAVEEARRAKEKATRLRLRLEGDVAPQIDAQLDDLRISAEAGRLDPFVALETLARAYEARVALVDARLAETTALENTFELLGPKPAVRIAESRPVENAP